MISRSRPAARHAPLAALAGIVALVALVAPPPSHSVVPVGFSFEPVVTGPFVGQPVAFAFLPDGRPLLAERTTGIVRVAAVGAATADPVLTVPDVEAVHPERGLLGIAVDPEWPARPYLYVHFTRVDSVSVIERWTGTGDLADPQGTALSFGDPYVLLDDIPDVNGIHEAGTARFGPDGMLYLSCGDDGQSCPAQDLDSPLGKILRIDPSGLPAGPGGPPAKIALIATGNPFPGPGPWAALVWAWGLRNPFRFTIDAPTGDIWIGNVGSSYYEEIEVVPRAAPGTNHGWPQVEGPQVITCCGTCGQGNVFTDPAFVIPHPLESISVIGGFVVRTGAGATPFPPDYEGDYLYFRIFAGTAHRIRDTGGAWDFAPPVPGQPDPTTWADGLWGVCDAQLGPDGALWFVSLGLCCGVDRGLYRIAYDGSLVDAPARDATADGGSRLRVQPNPFAAGTIARIAWESDASGPSTVHVHDLGGRLVRTLVASASGNGAGAQAHAARWDGRDATGRAVAPGIYLLRVVGAGGRGTGPVAKVTVLR